MLHNILFFAFVGGIDLQKVHSIKGIVSEKLDGIERRVDVNSLAFDGIRRQCRPSASVAMSNSYTRSGLIDSLATRRRKNFALLEGGINCKK